MSKPEPGWQPITVVIPANPGFVPITVGAVVPEPTKPATGKKEN